MTKPKTCPVIIAAEEEERNFWDGPSPYTTLPRGGIVAPDLKSNVVHVYENGTWVEFQGTEADYLLATDPAAYEAAKDALVRNSKLKTD